MSDRDTNERGQAYKSVTWAYRFNAIPRLAEVKFINWKLRVGWDLVGDFDIGRMQHVLQF